MIDMRTYTYTCTKIDVRTHTYTCKNDRYEDIYMHMHKDRYKGSHHDKVDDANFVVEVVAHG